MAVVVAVVTVVVNVDSINVVTIVELYQAVNKFVACFTLVAVDADTVVVVIWRKLKAELLRWSLGSNPTGSWVSISNKNGSA